MGNAIMVIAPYWYMGAWVFDDREVGLVCEPFVSGVPEMINELVEDIPDARDGFRMTFSAGRFPGFQPEMTWVREEDGGHWYRSEEPLMEGWLCTALFKYFDEAPEKLFVRADPVQQIEQTQAKGSIVFEHHIDDRGD